MLSTASDVDMTRNIILKLEIGHVLPVVAGGLNLFMNYLKNLLHMFRFVWFDAVI